MKKTFAIYGQVSWLLLPNWFSFLSGGTVQPENTYCCILEQVSSAKTRKGQASASIAATTSVHKVVKIFRYENTATADNH